jgi:hypothetical protein
MIRKISRMTSSTSSGGEPGLLCGGGGRHMASRIRPASLELGIWLRDLGASWKSRGRRGVVEFRSDEPVANYGPYEWPGLGRGRTRGRDKQYALPDFST